MTLIWKQGYTTGVPELDEQHRQIFDMLNYLENLIHKGVSEGPELEELLNTLGKHVTRHFADEEHCMDKAHCPMALKNKQEHEQFLNSYVDFTSKFSRDKSLQTLRDYHTSAESWMLQHVAFLDIHLRSCVEHGKE